MKHRGDFPYQFSRNREQHWEVTKWCEQNIGPRWKVTGDRSGTWTVFWAGRDDPGKYQWHFLNERDAMLFALRWL